MALSTDERQKLDDIHRDLGILLGTVGNHDTVLFGVDRKDGLAADVALTRERQDTCPARKRAARDNRMFVVACVSLLLTIAALAVGYGRLVAMQDQIANPPVVASP